MALDNQLCIDFRWHKSHTAHIEILTQHLRCKPRICKTDKALEIPQILIGFHILIYSIMDMELVMGTTFRIYPITLDGVQC